MSDTDTDAQEIELPVHSGDLIGGKYRVDRVLAAGGMGAVVQATHVKLGKRVAIKLLLPELVDCREAVTRFLHEAHAAARLQSDFIAGVADVDTLDDGTPYMVMDFVEGECLGEVLKDGPLPIEQAVKIGMQVCLGLAVAHTQGIVHRDIKPSNLMLTTTFSGEERAVILDFGIAKIENPLGCDGSITNTRSLLGSPMYMSPEQVGNAKNVDRRSDIWSLGVVLWQMLTGESLFDGETVGEVLAAILCEQPRPPSALREEISPELEDVVLRCLERQRGDRHSTAHELLHALAPFASQRARVSLVRFSDRPPPSSAPVSAVDVSAGRSLAIRAPVSATASTLIGHSTTAAGHEGALSAIDGLTAAGRGRQLVVGLLAAVAVAGVGLWLNSSSPTASQAGGGTASAPETAEPAAQHANAAVSPLGHESAKPSASAVEAPPASSPTPPAPSHSAPAVAVIAHRAIRTPSPTTPRPPPPPSPSKATSTYSPFNAPPGALDSRK